MFESQVAPQAFRCTPLRFFLGPSTKGFLTGDPLGGEFYPPLLATAILGRKHGLITDVRRWSADGLAEVVTPAVRREHQVVHGQPALRLRLGHLAHLSLGDARPVTLKEAPLLAVLISGQVRSFLSRRVRSSIRPS